MKTSARLRRYRSFMRVKHAETPLFLRDDKGLITECVTYTQHYEKNLASHAIAIPVQCSAIEQRNIAKDSQGRWCNLYRRTIWLLDISGNATG